MQTETFALLDYLTPATLVDPSFVEQFIIKDSVVHAHAALVKDLLLVFGHEKGKVEKNTPMIA